MLLYTDHVGNPGENGFGCVAAAFASLDDEADNKLSQSRFKKDRKNWSLNDHGLQYKYVLFG